jgi:hypothetical protein
LLFEKSGRTTTTQSKTSEPTIQSGRRRSLRGKTVDKAFVPPPETEHQTQTTKKTTTTQRQEKGLKLRDSGAAASEKNQDNKRPAGGEKETDKNRR